MKFRLLLLIPIIISLGLIIVLPLDKSKPEKVKINNKGYKYVVDGTVCPDDAAHMEYMMTRDPVTKEIPARALWDAYQQTLELCSSDGLSPLDLHWEERGPDNVGGRTRAIMFDPNDPTNSKVWAGSTSGGLWYIDDIGAITPSWHIVNDFWKGLSVACMAYDPTDPSHFYVGTGEGYLWRGMGVGIYKSFDGGATWDTITSTFFTPHFKWVQDIVIHPVTGDIYASTIGYNSGVNGGILRSKNDGVTWEVVLNKNTSPTSSPTNRGGDLEICNDNYIYATMGVYDHGAMYRSTTGDAGDWTYITNGIDTANSLRFELAVSPSSPEILFVSVADTFQGVQGLYRSINRGNSWTPIATPMIDATDDYAEGQAVYDNILLVHPTDPDIVFAGGVKLFRSYLYGLAWHEIFHIHDDHHMMVSDPSSTFGIVFGNDGGVYYTNNCLAAVPPIFDKNKGYNVTQFYTLAYHPRSMSNFMLGGTQDNGTPRFEHPGMNSTTFASNADGAYCFINKWLPQYQITGKQWNHYCRSLDWGATFNEFVGVNKGWLIPPADYDHDNGNLYSSVNQDSILRVRNTMGAFSYDFMEPLGMGSMGSAIKISPYDNLIMLVGTNEGKLFKIERPDDNDFFISELNTAGLPDGNISCIAWGSDNDHILITMSNYGVISVWETVDYCDTWSNKEGNLLNMPVRWAVYNPLDYRQVFLATELGVWTTEDITVANPSWLPANQDLAYVRTEKVMVRPSDLQLFAATYGRGIFTSNDLEYIPQQKLIAGDGSDSARLGFSVDMYGGEAIAGAKYDNEGRGAAYIYDLSGSTWSETAKLTAANGLPDDYFGHAVAIDGTYAAISALYDDQLGNEAGAVYIFFFDGSNWTQQNKLIAGDGEAGDRFGASVDLWGKYLIVGATGDDDMASFAGAAYIYARSGTSWILQEKIYAESPMENASFGASVAIYDQFASVGSPTQDIKKGEAYMYKRSGTSWSYNDKTFYGASENDWTGKSVAIWQDKWAIGVPYGTGLNTLNSGLGLVFDYNGSNWSSFDWARATDGWDYYSLGYDVDIIGDYLIMGSPGEDEMMVHGGGALIFKYNRGEYDLLCKLYSNDMEPDDWFGNAVAISNDFAMVGCTWDDNVNGLRAGAVYFFQNYTTGTPIPELSVAPLEINVSATTNSCVINVYNVGTGNMLWTAIPNDPWLSIEGSSTGVNNGNVEVNFNTNDYCQRSGSVTISAPEALHSPKVVIINQVATGNDTERKIKANDIDISDSFGRFVDIDGDYAIVGAYYQNNPSLGTGSAYIFVNDGDNWNEQAKLSASDGATNDFFGWGIAISGEFAVAGARGHNATTGAAYLFQRPVTGWTSTTQTAKLTASDGGQADLFGYCVDVSNDCVIVGAPGHNQGQGAVYIFEKPFTGWADMNETEKLVASGIGFTDNFAHDVAISGMTAVVGAYSDDGKGAAYVFEKNWVWSEKAKLTASDGVTDNEFGCSVDIFANNIIVGDWENESFKGKAYIFIKPGDEWVDTTETHIITANDGVAYDHFGYAVGIDHHNAIVGAKIESEMGINAGAAYAFLFNDTIASQEAKIMASDGQAYDYFGIGVAISNEYTIIGAYGDDDMGSGAGAAYIYCNTCDTLCTQELGLTPSGVVDLDYEKGKDTVWISNLQNCDMTWTATSDAAWLIITEGTEGINDGFVEVSYPLNPDSVRKAHLVIRSTEAFNSPDTVTFRQRSEDHLVLGGQTIQSGDWDCWDAEKTIVVPDYGELFVVNSSGIAYLVAGEKIVLRPGFHAMEGSQFMAVIDEDGCAIFMSDREYEISDLHIGQELDIGLDKNDQILIYPNPTTDNVNVYFDFYGNQLVKQVQIWYVLGNLIKTINHPEGKVLNLDMNYPHGLYIIQVKTDKDSYFKKVLKQ